MSKKRYLCTLFHRFFDEAKIHLFVLKWKYFCRSDFRQYKFSVRKGNFGLRQNDNDMKKIQIMNGPNLNLLGKREPSVYGAVGFETYLEHLHFAFPDCDIQYFQSNLEGALINKIQEVGFSADGIVLNAGGYTHTSVALRDAIKAVDTPVIEIHISNVHAREEFRHHSMLAAVCKGVIAGFGLDSYRLAIEALRASTIQQLNK